MQNHARLVVVMVGSTAVFVICTEHGFTTPGIVNSIMAPEPVAHTGGDDERVVVDVALLASGGLYLHACSCEVGVRDPPMDEVNGIKPTKASVGHEIGAFPSWKVGESGSQLLATHEGRPGRHADHIEGATEARRYEHAGIAQTCNHHGWFSSCQGHLQ